MFILGIDPGSRITGYGLIQTKGSNATHVENGAIVCYDAPSFNDRLVILFQKLQALIHHYKPEQVALEKIFYSNNAKSALKLGHARGAAVVAVALLKIPVFEYSAREIKVAITGYGAASKEQIQKMIKTLLGLPQIAEENASDALAVALCHANSLKMKSIST